MLKVTCAIIIKNNKILIAQNNEHSDHPFQWEFPGGKIQRNETARECIKREIMEELDIGIEILRPMVSIDFDYGIKEIKLIPFLCTIKKRKIKLNEHHDYKWIKLDEIENFNLASADRKLFQQSQNSTFLKEYIREQVHKY